MQLRNMLPVGTEKKMYYNTDPQNNISGHGQEATSVPPGPWEANAHGFSEHGPLVAGSQERWGDIPIKLVASIAMSLSGLQKNHFGNLNFCS